ncbi:hypothetical protein FD755_013825, partial [Muntiacus reevesi]
KIFKKGFAGDYRVKMTPRKPHNLCELSWLSSDVGWLPEDTLDIPTVQTVHQVFTGSPGPPNQFPYIDSWLLIAQTGKKPIFQGDPVEDQLLPLPYIPLTPQTPAQPALDPLPDSLPPPPPRCPPHHLMSKTPAPSQEGSGSAQPNKTQGPQQVNKAGSACTADLLNWKHHGPEYSNKPQAVTDFLESIFYTDQPTWDDSMPEMRPNWDFNTRKGQETLSYYHDALLHGLRVGVKKSTNMSKITTIQKPDKTPTSFYERLCEMFWIYTPFDPEKPKNQQMINAALLQKLEGFAGMNATQLLEVASKISRTKAVKPNEKQIKK